MNLRKSIATIVAGCLILAASAPLAVAAGQEEAAGTGAEPVVLRAVSFGPLSHNNAVPLEKFMQRVNEQAKGELEIKYLGATEVAALYDQPEALRTGVFDLLIIFPAAYVGILPIVGGMNLGNLDPPEWRRTGAHEFLVETHKGANMMYLGSFAAYEDGSYLFLKKKISRPEQLAGLKFAAGPTNLASIQAWGGSGVRVPMAEKYSALERGVVDGVAGVLASHYTDSLYEVTSCWVPYSLCSALTAMLMNLDSWNRLPAHLQTMLTDIMVELEVESVDLLRTAAEDIRQKLLEEGMEIVEFSPSDAERFQEVALGAKWAEIERDVDPALVSKFRAMLND
ncbi:MAG: TRAP transporter substrate-binding protein DctP [Spirochaetales bacterium]|nr:TRAP transporter substrate-binding protein DctP [Spirochaetales bacterium]